MEPNSVLCAADIQPKEIQDRLLSLQEAAVQLGYSPSGLRKVIDRTKNGKPGPQIQFHQVGAGRIKFRQEWLDEFVLTNSTEPGQVVPLKKSRSGRKPAPTRRTRIEPHWSMAV